MGFCN